MALERNCEGHRSLGIHFLPCSPKVTTLLGKVDPVIFTLKQAIILKISDGHEILCSGKVAVSPILKTNTSFSLVADKDMSSLQTNVNLVMRVI